MQKLFYKNKLENVAFLILRILVSHNYKWSPRAQD